MSYKKLEYTDRQLYQNTQSLYLNLAGFIIKLSFKPSEHVVYKRMYIEDTEKIWGSGGFLNKTAKKHDFEIEFVPAMDRIEIIEKEEGRKHYYLSLIRNFSSRKITCFYNTSLATVHLIIKEILGYLLNDSGFILHASSCLDRNDKLHIFLAVSGGGKTTTADTLKKLGWDKSSDDLLIAKKTKERWVFYRAPFVEKDAFPIKGVYKKATFYVIKKSKNTRKTLIKEHKKILKIVIQQLWLRTGTVVKENLRNAIDLVLNNEFYELEIALNDKKLATIIK